jgi:hypothetical protein
MDVDVERDLVKHLRDPAPLRAVVHHPRNHGVTRAKWGHGYERLDATTGRLTRLAGLTPLLERVYWSSDKPAPAPARRGVKRAREPAPLPGGVANGGIMGAVRGAVRGTIVHEQAHDLVTLSADALKRRCPQRHAWSEAVVHALLDHHVLPAAGNVPAYVEALGLCTEIDLLGVEEPSGHLVVVEIKTGYSGGAWRASRGPMRGVLAGVLDDTPLNRALVQVMVATLLLVEGHAVAGGRIDAWVIHVDERGARRHVLGPEFMAHYGPLVVRELALHARSKG